MTFFKKILQFLNRGDKNFSTTNKEAIMNERQIQAQKKTQTLKMFEALQQQSPARNGPEQVSDDYGTQVTVPKKQQPAVE